MPVYWRPRIPTRVMRERAFAERSLARERALEREAKLRGDPGLAASLRLLLARVVRR